MTNISWVAVGPLAVLLSAVVALLTVEVLGRPRRRVWYAIAGAALVAALVLSVIQFDRAVDKISGPGGQVSLHFSEMLIADPFAAVASVVLILIAGGGLLLAIPLIAEQGRKGAEFIALVLVGLSGLILMTNTPHLILLFLGLEVASLAFYVLAGFSRRHAESEEAAVKYFLLGSLASAVFLYGAVLAYAATGTFSLIRASNFLESVVVLRPGVLLIGIGLMVVGLGFKVSAAPFHMWAPDVYQGAASGISGFLSAAAKTAGFAALARVLIQGFERYRPDWAPALGVLAAASIVLGTLLAIAQTDIKRMLAYSSVSHAGFILTGLVAGEGGLRSVWFYLITYAVQVLVAFGVVGVVSGGSSGKVALADFSGLAARSPFLAAVLTLMMLAMAGLPLTTGFIGKVGVFEAAIEADYLWLVILGVISAVAGLFFYLRVIVLMYMSAPAAAEAPAASFARPEPSAVSRFALTAGAAVTVAFGLIPQPLLEVAGDALLG